MTDVNKCDINGITAKIRQRKWSYLAPAVCEFSTPDFCSSRLRLQSTIPRAASALCSTISAKSKSSGVRQEIVFMQLPQQLQLGLLREDFVSLIPWKRGDGGENH